MGMHNRIGPKRSIRQSRERGAVIDRLFTTAMTAFISSQLAIAIGPLVDGVVVGMKYSVEDVAAIGLTASLLVGYRTVSASIITRGSHVIASRRIGAGDKDGANQTFSLAVTLSLAIAVTLALLSILFSDYIAVFLGARRGLSHLLIPTSDYLKGYCVGLPFFAMTNVLTPYLQMDGDYDRVTLSSIVMTVVDILADLYVVKFTSGGLLLIGLATSVAYVASFLVVVSHFVFKKSIFRFSLKKINWSESRDIIATGMPTGVVKLSNTFCGIVINQMLAVSFTGAVVAALGVGNQVLKTCFSLWLGSASTLMSFSSMFYGEEDKQAIRVVMKTALKKGLMLTCTAAVVSFVFAAPLANVFMRNGTADEVKMAADSIRFFAMSMPLNVFIYSFQVYLIGVGRKMFANVYSFILDFAIPVPVTMLFLMMIGYRGVWIATPVINVLVVLVAVIYILRQDGKGFKEKMLLLPKDFGVAPEHEFSFEGDSMFDVVGISRTVIAFMLENGYDKRKADMVSLAVEELAGNIVQHGFSDGRSHHVDIRLLAKEGDLILRFRDDCKRFDPVDEYRTQLQFSKNPEEGIGIKMMIRLAKDIKYTGLYGMNNLIVRL